MRRPLALHRALVAAVGAFNRIPWTSNRLALLPRQQEPFYAEDGLWTYHSHAFVDAPKFARAYQRAMQATGDDYELRWRTHLLLWAAEAASSADGAFVECGTGRGFMASAICEYLDWDDRPFFLYDTFLPSHPQAGGDQSGGPAHPCYAAGPQAVAANFSEWPGVKLVVGRLPQSLKPEPETVAFLHIDLNHAVTEEAVARHFWPRLSIGGLMIFDDYGFKWYQDTREMVDRLATELGFSVFASPTGQGLVVKTGPGPRT